MQNYVTTILPNIRLICNLKKKICIHFFEELKILYHRSDEQNLAGRKVTAKFMILLQSSIHRDGL